MNDTSATLRATARTEPDAGASAPEGGAPRGMSTERTARRLEVIRDLLLDSLRGSMPYVKSYRAGRGAE